jgi:hypothetical protein
MAGIMYTANKLVADARKYEPHKPGFFFVYKIELHDIMNVIEYGVRCHIHASRMIDLTKI